MARTQSIDDKIDTAEKYRGLIEKSNQAAKEKDYSTAVRLADQALTLNPERYEAYFAKGGALTWKGDYAEAEELLTLGINIMNNLNYKSSRVFLPYFYRGFARMRQEKYNLADEDFTKVLELNHDYKFAYDARAKVRAALGKHDDAASDREKGTLADMNRFTRALEGFR